MQLYIHAYIRSPIGIFPLGAIFSVIAVFLICGTILINYYRKYPKFDMKGNKINNSLRRKLISSFVNELFLDIDYNLIIIFIGKFIYIFVSIHIHV